MTIMPAKHESIFKVVTFYHFLPLADLPGLRAMVRAWAQEIGAVGTFLIAPEGVNTTLAGDDPRFPGMVDRLVDFFAVPAVNVKWSTSAGQPFGRLKVRIKKEIITLKQPTTPTLPGQYVAPKDWNALITQDDVLVIDTRNTYETAHGTFWGAVDPGIAHFSHFTDYVDGLDPATTPKVAMYCTGGIRCEKAAAYMKARGFRDVYQLEGGILRYLEVMPPDQSLWQGSCFVFDERIAVGHGVIAT
jgi:UPF0176 protein